jgi:hypothetical protein
MLGSVPSSFHLCCPPRPRLNALSYVAVIAAPLVIWPQADGRIRPGPDPTRAGCRPVREGLPRRRRSSACWACGYRQRRCANSRHPAATNADLQPPRGSWLSKTVIRVSRFPGRGPCTPCAPGQHHASGSGGSTRTEGANVTFFSALLRVLSSQSPSPPQPPSSSPGA